MKASFLPSMLFGETFSFKYPALARIRSRQSLRTILLTIKFCKTVRKRKLSKTWSSEEELKGLK